MATPNMAGMGHDALTRCSRPLFFVAWQRRKKWVGRLGVNPTPDFGQIASATAATGGAHDRLAEFSQKFWARTGVPGYLRRTGPMSSLTIGKGCAGRVESRWGVNCWAHVANWEGNNAKCRETEILLFRFCAPASTIDLLPY